MIQQFECKNAIDSSTQQKKSGRCQVICRHDSGPGEREWSNLKKKKVTPFMKFLFWWEKKIANK